MKKFILKTFLLILTLFVGILIGMNKANQGMMDMKGYNDQSFQTPVTVQKTPEGEVQAAVLGNDLPPFSLDDKKEKIEKAKAFNFFSEAGKLLAEIVTTIFQTIIDFIASLIP
ncbi:DUF3679 domain-containing protein [Bacillus niameyensis]|uniref:DUF3679 domain-containing protein n=1 Tax=Bacillus niameyensis TaxID=1522308 RepID=UPI0007837141|nr:DUF3679 domain-containing protein [Bacillus niameyensis]